MFLILNGVNIISDADIYIYIDVPRPLTNDLWVLLFHTIDIEYVKWASPARTYVYVKAFIVNVNKCLKPLFLEQHINIVNRVTLQSFWLICSCLSYTQRKDGSNKHLHTLSTKLIIVRFWTTVRRVYLVVSSWYGNKDKPLYKLLIVLR